MTGSLPIAIVGPTAAGKTALSLRLALRIQGEIISMDSRQVYRGMDIGTAKATPQQRSTVPHFGLDLVEPGERFSAGRFGRYARERIAEIQRRGSVPILVGGTGFFLRALTHPIFREPEMDAVRRADLARYLQDLDVNQLLRWLRLLDPPSAHRLSSWGGKQRLLRALELPLLTGRTLSFWQATAGEAEPLKPLVFVLDLPRPLLDEAIGDRVEKMIEAGLVSEVAGLLSRGYDENSPGLNATGYIELIPHLRGETTLEQAREAIARNTRSYSRRQLTWFRNQLGDEAVWLDGTARHDDLVEEMLTRIRIAQGLAVTRTEI
jgi:tRNA dimethylallyltransferase